MRACFRSMFESVCDCGCACVSVPMHVCAYMLVVGWLCACMHPCVCA